LIEFNVQVLIASNIKPVWEIAE